MPGSIQLDAETEALLDQMAQTQRRAKTDILREAMQRFAQEEQTRAAEKPYDLLVDLIGIAEGGPDDDQGRARMIGIMLSVSIPSSNCICSR